MSDLLERLRDSDAIVMRGLFHAVPAMKDAAYEIEELRAQRDALNGNVHELGQENAKLREQLVSVKEAIADACDLLAERKYGNPARSPGHNARSRLERAQEQISALSDEKGD